MFEPPEASQQEVQEDSTEVRERWSDLCHRDLVQIDLQHIEGQTSISSVYIVK